MNKYLSLLIAIQKVPRTILSDCSNEHTLLLAEASSRQHISCLSFDGSSLGRWEITSAGRCFIYNLQQQGNN